MSLSSEQLEPKLTDKVTLLANDLAALRAKFDRYFHGLEKRHPSNDIDAFRKRMLALKTEVRQNTAIKFRLQGIIQKFQAYERLWLKTIREIEQGTSRRDLMRLKRKNNSYSDDISLPNQIQEIRQEIRKDKEDFDLDVDIDLKGVSSPLKAPSSAESILPPAQKDGASATPLGTPSPISCENFSVTPEMIGKVFDKYLVARKLCNESTEGITPEKIARNIQKQLPQILKNKCVNYITFEVTIHKGKAFIRAVTK